MIEVEKNGCFTWHDDEDEADLLAAKAMRLGSMLQRRGSGLGGPVQGE